MSHEKHERFEVSNSTKNCLICYGKGAKHDFTKNEPIVCIACKGTGKATR